jgi:mRNA interferase MazF
MEIPEHFVPTFIEWTLLKVRIHLSDRKFFPRKREIWWISLGKNVGVEANGKNEKFERPVLIIKVFNEHSSLVAPISSTIKPVHYLFQFINVSGVPNSINLSQMRMVSSKRFIRKIGEMDLETFEEVREMLKNIL